MAFLIANQNSDSICGSDVMLLSQLFSYSPLCLSLVTIMFRFVKKMDFDITILLLLF